MIFIYFFYDKDKNSAPTRLQARSGQSSVSSVKLADHLLFDYCGETGTGNGIQRAGNNML